MPSLRIPGCPNRSREIRGTSRITLLGILLDHSQQQLWFPDEKLAELVPAVVWLGKHTMTKRELLSLIVKLSFVVKVVTAGFH